MIETTNTMAQREALKLLVASTVLSSRLGDVVDVSPKVQQKYQVIRGTTLATVQLGALAAGVGASVKSSAEEFRSVLVPITELVKFLGRVIVEAGRVSADMARALRLDYLAEQSSLAVERSYQVIEPLVKIFVNRGSAISFARRNGTSVCNCGRATSRE